MCVGVFSEINIPHQYIPRLWYRTSWKWL